MTLGAIGVVFGDIGTSPLYALATAFSMEHNPVAPTRENVYGTISLVLWTITLIVTFKYVLLLLRADNDGAGGILALVALLRRSLGKRRSAAAMATVGMIGAALFYGDAVITPAISVLSAVEGLTVSLPQLEPWVVPVAAVILTGVFLVQPSGTGVVGRLFGPVMLVWFTTMAALGIPQIVRHPEVLWSLSPHWAVRLLVEHPIGGFLLFGAVVLTVTGAEALYADLGHFGRKVIVKAWFAVVLPSLALVYLGQGALVIEHPEALRNPFFYLAPEVLRIPLVVLATAATIIASQAVISGAFSVTHQAMRLDLLPRFSVLHTSRHEGGQIYIPAVSWALFLGVLALVLMFGSSAALASAYGLAVTGTLVLESALFLVLARWVWRWSRTRVLVFAGTIGLLELALLAANAVKVLDGGWIPLVIAILVLVVMETWRQGRRELDAERREAEAAIDPFVGRLGATRVRRLPGVAVFPHANPDTAPLALVQCVERLDELHRWAFIVQVEHMDVPHVRHVDRVSVARLGRNVDGLFHVTIRVGFTDTQDIPHNLPLASRYLPGVKWDKAVYYLSTVRLAPPATHRLRDWRHRLFALMFRNQADRVEVFHLPPDRTVVLGAELTGSLPR